MALSGYRGRCFFVLHEDIEKIDSNILEALECGDEVIKMTGNMRHLYLVSYKEAHQGICLTYTAAGLVETVSYDYNAETKKWVFNSIDKWEKE